MDSTYYTQEIIINRFAPIFPKNFHYHFKFDFFFCLIFPFSSFCLQDEPIKLGPDQYGCPFCQFSTKRKDVMEKHICTHTGKKPFKCSFCSYSAVQNSDLKNHFKRRHAEYYVHESINKQIFYIMPRYCLYFPLIEFDYYSSSVKNQDYESEILILINTYFDLFC